MATHLNVSIFFFFLLSSLIFISFLYANLPVNIFPVTISAQNQSQGLYSPDDLPKTVARTLNQGSSPMSMDFHPVQQTILLGQLL